MKPGRNDPCPCGSGRKYKKCCMEAAYDLESQRVRLRRAEGRLAERVLPYAEGRYGPELVNRAWQAFFFYEGVPKDMSDDPHADTIFLPWMLLDWVPADARRRRRSWPSMPLALDYLQTVGESDPFVERIWRKISNHPYSFYAVLEVKPGERIKIQDVLTLAEYVVLEQSASRMVRQGCILFSKVVTEGQVSILLGAAPILIPPIERARLIELREDIESVSGGKITEDMLTHLQDALRQGYLALARRQLQPFEPELRNTEGDPLVFHTLRFRLRCSPQEAFDSLKSLAWDHEEEDLLADAKFDRAGQLRAVEFPWCVEGNPVHKSWSNTIFGHFFIKGETLKVEVNSERRAERVCAEIRSRLGEGAQLQGKVVKSSDKLLEGSRSRPETAAERRRREQAEEFARLPEVQEHMRQMAERHWEEWLGMQIPALGGRTPREAARSTRGKELLEALLADYALRSGGQSDDAFAAPLEELRSKLGLTAIS